MTPGKIVYSLFYRPAGFLKRIGRRGLKRSWQQEQGRRCMLKAAYSLKGIEGKSGRCFDVYFLTGQKYWYQTAFCLFSLQKDSSLNIKAWLVDDGSFDDDLESQVLSQFPGS